MDFSVFDEINEVVYVSDIETYDIIYLNRFGMESLTNLSREMLIHTDRPKCYKVLQQGDKPCAFCNNQQLLTGGVCKWERRNHVLDRHYLIVDQMIRQSGRNLRLELAIDISKRETDAQQTRSSLQAQRSLVQCIQKIASSDEFEPSINHVLETILNYYHGNRAYIFEFYWDTGIMDNTYERCAEGVSAEIGNLQNMPIDMVHLWIRNFIKNKYIQIDDIEEMIAAHPERIEEYETLKAQDIRSLLAVPFYINDEIQGFLGVDDPKKNQDNIEFLLNLTYFISNEMEKRKIHKRLHDMSYLDNLTHLGNRNSYSEYIQDFERRSPLHVGLLFGDLNGLKYINDTFGHEHGDESIARVGEIMRKHFPNDRLFRISGDEFVIACENCDEQTFSNQVFNLQKALGTSSDAMCAVGSAWFERGTSFSQMIYKAEQLMYINKQQFYMNHVDHDSKHRPKLLQMLLETLDRGQYRVYLQPKAEMKSGKIMGAEALVRHFDENGKMVLPYQFIPLFEKEKIISRVDFFVLTEVCKMLERWNAKTHVKLRISLNFSRITLLGTGFLDTVVSICDEYLDDYSQLSFEITESADVIDNKKMLHVIAGLKKHGFVLELDDFGVDYSSMEMLTVEGLNIVKLDYSLTKKMNQRTHQLLIHSIITLSHELGLKCIAEGVETPEQLEMLRDMDCDYMQGFLLDKPMSIEEFEQKYM